LREFWSSRPQSRFRESDWIGQLEEVSKGVMGAHTAAAAVGLARPTEEPATAAEPAATDAGGGGASENS
jgi:hypothetical protein